MTDVVNEQTPAPTRYIELAEFQALEAKFTALVAHVERVRFDGSTIELPAALQDLIA